MKNINWKKIIPHLIAIGVFLIVALVYCKPALQGKVLSQGDVIHWKGMAANSVKYKETHGTYPLWTNGMFSGMPAYQIFMDPQNPFNIIYLQNIFTLFLGKPFMFFFMLCLGFYFLSQVFGVDYRLGILGSIGYAYASFSSILVIAGHETQVEAMAYMPAVLAGILLVYKRRYLLGGTCIAVFMGLLIAINHLQITYYLLIVAAFMTIYYLIEWIKAKDYKHIIKSFLIVAAASLLGVASNLVTIATTYDYSKATMRNGVLNLDSSKKNTESAGGLPIDYAFQWSFEKPEVFSVLVPNVYGGVSGIDELNKNSHLAKLAKDQGASDDDAINFAKQTGSQLGGLYWGSQPFTSGPVYFGAIICFLFLFGMIYLKRTDKWWILAVCVLAFMMSWGRNFPAFNDFLFNHLPLYNKFRVPTYTLVIPQLLFPLLAVITLHQIFFIEIDKAFVWKKLKITGITTVGIFLILLMMYSSFDYKGSEAAQIASAINNQTDKNQSTAIESAYNALKADRQSLFADDILRSLIFIAIAFTCLWLYIKNKLKPAYAMLSIVLLSCVDVLAEGRRYLNDDSFQSPDDQTTQNFTPSAIDQQIMQDTSYYRVFNMAVGGGSFNDAMTSYFHNSVGGYHPAKLALYQDLITYQLSDKLNINVLNMLNTKYVITRGQNGQPEVQQNPGALGACWFVKHIEFVKDDAASMKALNNNNTADTAIVEQDEKSKITTSPTFNGSAKIQLIKNDNDIITYKSSSSTNEFAVFSEIYYDRGWKAYIDDKEVPIVRTNYVLRGLSVPAGNHTIRFEFKPASYYSSKTVEVAGSAGIWLLIIVSAVVGIKAKKNQIT